MQIHPHNPWTPTTISEANTFNNSMMISTLVRACMHHSSSDEPIYLDKLLKTIIGENHAHGKSDAHIFPTVFQSVRFELNKSHSNHINNK